MYKLSGVTKNYAKGRETVAAAARIQAAAGAGSSFPVVSAGFQPSDPMADRLQPPDLPAADSFPPMTDQWRPS